MKHEDIWRALDTLAAEHGLSASGQSAAPDLDAYATHVIACCVSPDGRILRPLVKSA